MEAMLAEGVDRDPQRLTDSMGIAPDNNPWQKVTSITSAN